MVGWAWPNQSWYIRCKRGARRGGMHASLPAHRPDPVTMLVAHLAHLAAAAVTVYGPPGVLNVCQAEGNGWNDEER